MVKDSSRTGTAQRARALGAVAGEPDATATLAAAFDRIEDGRRDEVKLDAVRTRAEVAMLTEEVERLTKRHGDAHPRVSRLRAVLDAVELQAKHAESELARLDRHPAPVAGGWTATGRVRREKGAPVADAEVAFVMSTGAETGLKPAKTDADGEFYATYPADVVKRLGDGRSQLSLVVLSGGKTLHRDPRTFVLQPNAIRQFRIEIPAAGKPVAPSKPVPVGKRG